MKWRQILNAEQLPCHNADVVTRFLLKLLYKQHVTCALLAIQELILYYNRKVAKQWSDHEHCPVKQRAVPRLHRMPVSAILPDSIRFWDSDTVLCSH